ncbi:hypothetical protein JGU66_20130 [Myxococcaceae bacterium JPH2]|nr:hypothetical protein [Myxococcaceae bacterium JPH2]
MALDPSAFDKDFGYLMPFLDKVAQAAAGLEDGPAREELGRLLSDEKVRWERIRALLRGAPAQAPESMPEAPSRRADEAPARRVGPSVPASGLTVGPLKRTP